MQLFFSTRSNARKSNAGKLCDNGVASAKGRRWGRSVNVTGGNKSRSTMCGRVAVTVKPSRNNSVI